LIRIMAVNIDKYHRNPRDIKQVFLPCYLQYLEINFGRG
jgi:hypothetical protein